MKYRYYTFSNKNGFMTKWTFLSEKQIEVKLAYRSDRDCFYSIQSYDEKGESKECPLYFDFDGPSAKADAMSLMHKIKDVLGVYPRVWDSGGKGYHVIVPVTIQHPRCEKIAKHIAKTFNPGKAWDDVVYKSRNMWRIPNTLNAKGVVSVFH